MRQGTTRRGLAVLGVAAALAFAGCGGGDDETTSTTASVETTTGATGASGATGAEGAAGQTYSVEDVQAAFEDEGFAVNDVTDSALKTPEPEDAISLTEKGETVGHGTMYFYESSADAKEAEKNTTVGGLDLIVVGNVLVEASKEPFEGFPTAEEMADTVESTG